MKNRKGEQPNRSVKQTRLVYGEGGDDGSWLKYLKSLLCRRSSNFVVKVKNGSGGSPVEVINDMTKLVEFSQYTSKYAVFDGDRAETEAAIRQATQCGINVIVSTGCLEEELLIIAGKRSRVSSTRRTSLDTRLIKKQFIVECGGHNERGYAMHFPLELLEQKRSDSEWLDSLMKLFE